MSQSTVIYGKSSIQKKLAMLISVQNSQTKFMHVIIVLVTLFQYVRVLVSSDPSIIYEKGEEVNDVN